MCACTSSFRFPEDMMRHWSEGPTAILHLRPTVSDILGCQTRGGVEHRRLHRAPYSLGHGLRGWLHRPGQNLVCDVTGRHLGAGGHAVHTRASRPDLPVVRADTSLPIAGQSVHDTARVPGLRTPFRRAERLRAAAVWDQAMAGLRLPHRASRHIPGP
jgi:hypothetical protein